MAVGIPSEEVRRNFEVLCCRKAVVSLFVLHRYTTFARRRNREVKVARRRFLGLHEAVIELPRVAEWWNCGCKNVFIVCRMCVRTFFFVRFVSLKCVCARSACVWCFCVRIVCVRWVWRRSVREINVCGRCVSAKYVSVWIVGLKSFKCRLVCLQGVLLLNSWAYDLCLYGLFAWNMFEHDLRACERITYYLLAYEVCSQDVCSHDVRSNFVSACPIFFSVWSVCRFFSGMCILELASKGVESVCVLWSTCRCVSSLFFWLWRDRQWAERRKK